MNLAARKWRALVKGRRGLQLLPDEEICLGHLGSGIPTLKKATGRSRWPLWGTEISCVLGSPGKEMDRACTTTAGPAISPG